MAAEGVPVKALDSYPVLLEIEEFYNSMFHACGNDFGNVKAYCSLFELSNSEILEAITILNFISKMVK